MWIGLFPYGSIAPDCCCQGNASRSSRWRRILAPNNVRRMHQSLHHVVADAPWSDEAVLDRVRDYALAPMTKTDRVVAWIVNDTGLPKKGSHSVGVARQYCGQTGKQDNCQVAVSLSVATWNASLPIAYRLYLPEAWANDSQRRQQAKIPSDVLFQTKLEIALGQIRQAVEKGVPQGTVLADPAYGNDTDFRETLAGMELDYVVGVQSTTTVWPLAPARCRRPRTRVADSRHAVCVATRSTRRYRPSSWPSRCR